VQPPWKERREPRTDVPTLRDNASIFCLLGVLEHNFNGSIDADQTEYFDELITKVEEFEAPAIARHSDDLLSSRSSATP
jgi:hypothetical protein